MTQTSKQLREKELWDKIERILIDSSDNETKHHFSYGRAIYNIIALLDSVREEYKGMIEGLRKTEEDCCCCPDTIKAIDEVLKQLDD